MALLLSFQEWILEDQEVFAQKLKKAREVLSAGSTAAIMWNKPFKVHSAVYGEVSFLGACVECAAKSYGFAGVVWWLRKARLQVGDSLLTSSVLFGNKKVKCLTLGTHSFTLFVSKSARILKRSIWCWENSAVSACFKKFIFCALKIRKFLLIGNYCQKACAQSFF